MRIAILGLGQLGGSLALAAKQAHAGVHIAGYDISKQHADNLLARGAVDAIYEAPEDAARDAELVFLTCPLREYASLVARIAPHLSENTLLSDVGSVQGVLHRAAASISTPMIPSHPIAGSERDGPDAARGDLFNGRLILLTPTTPEQPDSERLAQFWAAMGTQVVFMPPDVHDGVYAHVSHLPHLIAFASAAYLHDAGVQVKPEDAMLQQYLRISRSNARMWADVFIENHEALTFALKNVRAILNHMAGELESGEADSETLPQAEIAARFLPRMVASSLIACVSMYEEQSGLNLKHFSGAGLRDAISPASHEPEKELEAMSHVARALAGVVRAFDAPLAEFETVMESGDHAAMLVLLNDMREKAVALISQPH